jgi:hypothetical protein
MKREGVFWTALKKSFGNERGGRPRKIRWFISSAIARNRKSLSLTRTWRFHNNMYVVPHKGFREDFRQLLRRQQRLFVNEIDMELVEIFMGENGNFPKNEGVGVDVLECEPLLILDGFLESPDSLCCRNLDWKDAGARFAEHQTVEFNGSMRLGIQASVRVY